VSADAKWTLDQIDQRRHEVSKKDRKHDQQDDSRELIEDPEHSRYRQKDDQDAQERARLQPR